jgi:hypothetical protein
MVNAWRHIPESGAWLVIERLGRFSNGTYAYLSMFRRGNPAKGPMQRSDHTFKANQVQLHHRVHFGLVRGQVHGTS